MKEEIAREKEKADEYKLYMLEVLEKKVEWAAKNVENCDEEIMEKIRSEFREAIGIPCKKIVERMLENYREVRSFEQERGMSIDEMVAFVEENSDLVLDVKKLRNQRRALKREITRLNREREWLSGEVRMLGDIKRACDRAFQQGYSYAIQRFGPVSSYLEFHLHHITLSNQPCYK